MMLFYNVIGSLHGMVYLISLSKNSIASKEGAGISPRVPTQFLLDVCPDRLLMFIGFSSL
jgi:hypothetical protein